MHLDQISILPQQQRNEEDESNSNGIENELNAPIANIDLEDWLIDLISSDNSSNNAENSEMTASSAVAFTDDDDGLQIHNSNRMSKRTTSADRLHRYTEEYAADSIDLCNSLEDLVKTFDKNVKECLKNYKNIDIGQLAPVQVRTEDDLINDSQMWYTLTGNFGNLLPINYWSKNLIRRYHTRSLDLKLDCENSTRHKKPKQQRVQKITTTTTRRTGPTNKSQTSQQTNRNSYQLCNKQPQVDDEDDNYFYDEEEENFKAVAEKSQSRVAIESESNSDEDEFLSSDNETTSDSDSDDTFDEEDEEDAKKKGQFEGDDNNECGIGDEPLELDEIDDDELKEQLDMHSMIISRSLYNGDELDEPIITAEQVLNEIDSIIKLENDEVDYEERTPDSGCYSVVGGINTSSSTTDFNIDISYSKYINTFATQQEGQLQQHQHINDEQTYDQLSSPINEPSSLQTLVDLTPVTVVTTSKEELNRLNVFELNEIIDQIESTTKELSDILVHELALRDELEFEKETRNTFISLLMSIQEKRRKLSIDNCKNRHLASLSQKKKNRRSLGNFDFESNQPTHLTTVIPYNSGISSSIQNLQILINLLKAINEDSHQVPELLTNYILKVVCPT